MTESNKKFNVTGVCIPEKHYMVHSKEKIGKILNMVKDGDYFTINGARQYGKTTILRALKKELEQNFTVFSISFEGVGHTPYLDEESFIYFFVRQLYEPIEYGEVVDVTPDMVKLFEEMFKLDASNRNFTELSRFISKLCKISNKPIVLMIDEVDQASNHEMFLSFLGMLRDKFLRRVERPTFQSVILASVYDIKNLKLKIRPNEEHQYNSPWNIAADFTINLCFTVSDIGQMLSEYEKDNHCGMDINKIAQAIYDYTSGYPYLVSKICKLIDEKQGGSIEAGTFKWTTEGVRVAVKSILGETNTLFDDMRKKLDDYPKLREMIYDMLFQGFKIPFNRYNEIINIGVMFGFMSENDSVAVISNRIFETYFYNLFISEEALNSDMYKAGSMAKNQFIHNGSLDMELVMRKFSEYYHEIYRDSDERFVEENGRRLFLLYLKPIINGVGNYYIEAQTRDATRTDIVVDYLGERFVIELKIWRGKVYHEKGEKQLSDYLNAFNLNKGYMLIFSFNKNKQVKVEEVQQSKKTILEVVV